MPTTYRLDTAGFRVHLLNSAWMVAEMERRALRAKALFETIAPVGNPQDGDWHPGRFKSSARVSSGEYGGVNHDRAFGRLASVDPLALSKEYGHVTTTGRFVPGSHALVRSMDAMGGHGSARVAQFGGKGTAIRKKRDQLAARRARDRGRRRGTR